MTDQTTKSNKPSTAEVLAEVERRRAARTLPRGNRERRIVIWADRFVFWLSKHWLATVNTLAFIYVGLPILAPVLMRLGVPGLPLIVYTIYRPMCHQLPQRSWFLFGPKFAYTLPELLDQVEAIVLEGQWSGAFVGNPALGYKVALCQRDIAIYGVIFLSGLAYGRLRTRWKVRPLPWWAYIAFGILPMLIDGGYQLMTYLIAGFAPSLSISPHETTPLLRTITGSLFGWATVWLAYPYIEETMGEFRERLHQRFGWE